MERRGSLGPRQGHPAGLCGTAPLGPPVHDARAPRPHSPDIGIDQRSLFAVVDANRVNWQDRAHFLAVAAKAMRRVLVEHARARGSQRRGAGVQNLPLEAALNVHAGQSPDLVKLDGALTSLAGEHPRRAQVIELRFFGGLSVEETATVLGFSEDTVLRDWRLARIWLLRAMSGERAHAG